MKRKTFLQIFLLTLFCISILFVYGIIAVKSNSKTIIKERLEEETKLACSLIKSTDDFDSFSDYYNVFGAPRQIFFPFYIDLCCKVWYK